MTCGQKDDWKEKEVEKKIMYNSWVWWWFAGCVCSAEHVGTFHWLMPKASDHNGIVTLDSQCKRCAIFWSTAVNLEHVLAMAIFPLRANTQFQRQGR
jgi:hypothetical protein